MAAGLMDYVCHDLESCEAHRAEAVRIYRELGYRREFAWATTALSVSRGLQSLDMLGPAIELGQQGVALLRELDDLPLLAHLLNSMGILYNHYGDKRAAYEEALKIAIQIGDREREFYQYYNLGYVSLLEGNYQQAEALFWKYLDYALEFDLKPMVAEDLFALAGVFGLQGHNLRAARLMGAAECFMENFRVLFVPGDQKDFERSKTGVREQMGERLFEATWAEGRQMSLEQAIEYARGKTLT